MGIREWKLPKQLTITARNYRERVQDSCIVTMGDLRAYYSDGLLIALYTKNGGLQHITADEMTVKSRRDIHSLKRRYKPPVYGTPSQELQRILISEVGGRIANGIADELLKGV